MKKKLRILFLVLFIIIAVFVVTPMLMINRAKALVDEGIPADLLHSAPLDPFYDGIDLLETVCWFPYFRNQAQNLIDVYIGPYWANYSIDHTITLNQRYEEEEKRLQDECYETYSQYGRDSMDACFNIEYPPYPVELIPEDKALFCEKWKRFSRLLKEKNKSGMQFPVLENCE